MVFGLPMAFSMTVLAWSIIEYREPLKSTGQYSYAVEALKWGTDFMVKCHPSDNVYWMQVRPECFFLYSTLRNYSTACLSFQVGDGNADHACWQRPEDQSPRTAFQVNATKPGTEVVAEAAAALAAASMVFKSIDLTYSNLLLSHARKVRFCTSSSFPLRT